LKIFRKAKWGWIKDEEEQRRTGKTTISAAKTEVGGKGG